MYSSFCAGGVDPHRSTNDFDHSPTRDRPDTAIWHHARQPKNVVVAREGRAARGPRLLHVPSEHEPNDQPSRILTGGR